MPRFLCDRNFRIGPPQALRRTGLARTLCAAIRQPIGKRCGRLLLMGGRDRRARLGSAALVRLELEPVHTVLAGTSVASPSPVADKVAGLFGKFLLAVFAAGLLACGSGQGNIEEACGADRSLRDIEVSKAGSMEEAEFLTGASVGGVSADNWRSVTFITEMPLCVCSNVDVFVRGTSWLNELSTNVRMTVSLIQNGEVTPITLEDPASGFYRWEQGVPLQYKGHGGLSYSFSILINYSFPSVGSKEDDVAELRRILTSLDCKATYTTFTREPCANLSL